MKNKSFNVALISPTCHKPIVVCSNVGAISAMRSRRKLLKSKKVGDVKGIVIVTTSYDSLVTFAAHHNDIHINKNVISTCARG